MMNHMIVRGMGRTSTSSFFLAEFRDAYPNATLSRATNSLPEQIKKKKWIEPAARTVYVGVISIDTLRSTLRKKMK